MDEELEAIRAMYCEPGEFEMLENGSNGTDAEAKTIFRMHFTCDLHRCETDTANKQTRCITATFTLPKLYPAKEPQVSLHSSQHLTRKQSGLITEDLRQHSLTFLGEPMLMDLITWLQCTVSQLEKQTSAPKDEDGKKTCSADHVALLHLDHMRDRMKYSKTIVKWTTKLDLTGRLLFCDKLILILLLGEADRIQDFIRRLRTVNIDVDSKGRSCKERMMTVLREEKLPLQSNRLSDFEVVDFQSRKDLKELFKSLDLNHLFDEYVRDRNQ